MFSKNEPLSLRILSFSFAIAFFTAITNGEDIMKYYRIKQLAEHGMHAQGVVTRNQWDLVRVTKTKKRTVYRPVVSYTNKQNEKIEFQDYLDTDYSSLYPIGTTLNILYDDNNSKNAMIEQDKILIDKIHDRVFLSLGIIVASICTFIYALCVWLRIKKS